MNIEHWNQFVVEYSSPASFLQSWQWGEFQEALGNKIYRVEIGESIKAQVIVRKLPLNRTYLEIPKGPILDQAVSSKQISSKFVEELRRIGKKENAVLVRDNPPYENLDLQNQDFRKPEILMRQMEPARTILVDLSKSEEELMQNMHEKSRYNLRLAMRKGVRVRRATQDKLAFEKFLQLLEETAKRDKIVSWGRERFWKFREQFMGTVDSTQDTASSPKPRAELLVGELEGKILAAAIIMLFGDTGTYLYAASSAENRPANAPSLVLWEAILESKSQGMKLYDMWGVAPADEPNHAWAGITRFKSRYVKLDVTGREFFGSGTHDLVLAKSFYWLFKVAKKIRP